MKLKTLKRDRTRLLVKLLLPVCLMAFLPAGARAQAKLGIKGGIDVSEMTFSGDVFKKSNRMGFYVGPILKIPLFGLGFDIAALYTRRNGELKGSTEAGLDGKYKFTDKMIVVPIHARYGIDFGEGGIFAFAGPQFGFNLDGQLQHTLGKGRRSKAERCHRPSAHQGNLQDLENQRGLLFLIP